MRERLVAHRGNAAEFRENSLDAIRSAIEIGLAYVEFDVQMSSDAVPCLIHDSDLSRLYGVKAAVADVSCDQLQTLGIPSLEQAMAMVRRHAVTAFVEIKGDALERFGTEQVVTSVCEILTANCVVISFNQAAILAARAQGFRIGLIVRDLSHATRECCDVIRPEFIFCDQSHVTRKVWSGSVWVSYEVSDQRTASRLIGHGVQLLETMSVRKMSTLQ